MTNTTPNPHGKQGLTQTELPVSTVFYWIVCVSYTEDEWRALDELAEGMDDA